MNTTTNTRGVSEAMVEQETIVRLMDGKYELRHEHGRNFRALRYGEPWRDLTGDGMALALVQRIEELEQAALSAEPAAQGEEGFDARKYVRHMADVLEAGGDLFKVDADLLRLAAAINKAANTAPPAQPAERVPEVVRKALEVAQGDLHMLKKAIEARDPWSQLLLRVTDTERDLRSLLAASPNANGKEG